MGPARVLAVETKKDEDNNLHPTSIVWLVRGTKLVKVAMEQVRHASVRESCLHELTAVPQLPWTFSGISKEPGLHSESSLESAHTRITSQSSLAFGITQE